MTQRKSQADHDRMIGEVVSFLREKGYGEIRADLPDFEHPEEIVWRATGRGEVPDVTARSTSFIVVEVETEDTIEDAHTTEQWRLFSEHAREVRGEFFVVVPKGFMAHAWRRLKLLGLEANVWEI
ncbi:MAG: hypothetical protein HY900_23535 [Deltaproteobacteria bacterium]|nr:hypothetical protein [Deltaproteobacteria bacterium]